MTFFLPFIYVCLFLVLIRYWSFFSLSSITRNQLSLLFGIKLLAGVAIYVIYFYFYSPRNKLDAFRFFDDAVIAFNHQPFNLIDYLKICFGLNEDNSYFDSHYFSRMDNWYLKYDHNLYNDNRTIVRFNMLTLLMSEGNYHVHTVVINFISFIGLTALYKAVIKYMLDIKWLLIFAIFLVPSLLFWASGVLKEGLLIFAFGLFFLSITQLIEKVKINMIVLCSCATFLLIFLKFYVLIAIAPSILAWIVSKSFKINKTFLFFCVVYLISFLLLVNLKCVIPKYDFLKVMAFKQKDFINLAKEYNAGSYINIPTIDQSVLSIIKAAPSAMVNVLFRPLPFEVNNVFMAMASLENTLLIVFSVLCISFPKKEILLNKEFLYTGLFFIITLSLFIGLVTPILGAVVRYKIPLLPFCYIILFMLTDFKKIIAKFKLEGIQQFFTVKLEKWTK